MVSSHRPFELDARAPDFARECLAWSSQTQGEIQGLIAATKRVIADTRALMAEADRMIARY